MTKWVNEHPWYINYSLLLDVGSEMMVRLITDTTSNKLRSQITWIETNWVSRSEIENWVRTFCNWQTDYLYLSCFEFCVSSRVSNNHTRCYKWSTWNTWTAHPYTLWSIWPTAASLSMVQKKSQTSWTNKEYINSSKCMGTWRRILHLQSSRFFWWLYIHQLGQSDCRWRLRCPWLFTIW